MYQVHGYNLLGGIRASHRRDCGILLRRCNYLFEENEWLLGVTLFRTFEHPAMT
jgi:hypothetical protein